MKESTQEFVMLLAIIIGFLLFFGLMIGGLMYSDNLEKGKSERMYSKCIDTCERVFQEQKLIECMQTCNTLNSLSVNQTRTGSNG